jgi:small subunit ribosomal protein S11
MVKKIAKKITNVPTGNAYIHATYNNTIITLSDVSGNVLAWSSSGKLGFKGPKKSTPFVASLIAKDVVDKVQDYGLKRINVFVRGIGAGRDSAVRSLYANGLDLISVKDVTPVPHGGCRPPKPRRV